MQAYKLYKDQTYSYHHIIYNLCIIICTDSNPDRQATMYTESTLAHALPQEWSRQEKQEH